MGGSPGGGGTTAGGSTAGAIQRRRDNMAVTASGPFVNPEDVGWIDTGGAGTIPSEPAPAGTGPFLDTTPAPEFTSPTPTGPFVTDPSVINAITGEGTGAPGGGAPGLTPPAITQSTSSNLGTAVGGLQSAVARRLQELEFGDRRRKIKSPSVMPPIIPPTIPSIYRGRFGF